MKTSNSLFTKRTSSLAYGLQVRQCPLRIIRIISKPLIVAACRLHSLEAPCRADDAFEGSMICFDGPVQVLARPMLRIGCQLAFPLQPADGVRIGSELVCRDRGGRPVTHRDERFTQEAIGSSSVPPVRQHEVDQPAMLVNSTEQVLPLALLQKVDMDMGRPGSCPSSRRQAGWSSSCSVMTAAASASALAPIPKARSTMRASPRMSCVRLKIAAWPLRSARITSNPRMVA